MNRIIIIVPYFGNFNNYFSLWLEGCRMNSSIDWLLITDNNQKYNFPSNVIKLKTTLDILKNRIENYLKLDVYLDNPYKLCDFRPAYGDIFHSEISGYDFWGYCDLDLVWGNIRSFLTDQVLNNYDNISKWGHFHLVRNCKKMNTLYQLSTKGVPNYKNVFASNLQFCYDEIHGFYKMCQENDIKTYIIDDCFFDADYRWKSLKSGIYQKQYFNQSGINTFCYDGCNLFITGESDKNLLYIHLQKRPMRMLVPEYSERFYLKDNMILLELPPKKILDNLYNILPSFICWKQLYKRIKAKIFGKKMFYHYS